MFTKIKAALRNLASRIAHRIYTMGVEAELAKGVEEAEAALKSVGSEVGYGIEKAAEVVVTKVEAVFEPAPAPAAAAPAPAPAPVVTQPAAAAPAAPVAVSDIAATITKVKDLLDLAERLPASFDALAALAMKETTIEAVAVKLKSYLDYAKADAVDVFDEVLAAAKAL